MIRDQLFVNKIAEKFHTGEVNDPVVKSVKKTKMDKSLPKEKSILDDYNWRYRSGFNEYEPLVLIINNQELQKLEINVPALEVALNILSSKEVLDLSHLSNSLE